jgi:GNAT superfamily N-acetyltransferase
VRHKYSIQVAGPGDSARCEQIMRSLPEWFGIESSIVAYAQAVTRLESYLAVDDTTLAGFITIASRSDVASEIHALAVARPFHGTGAGRVLIEHVERLVSARGMEYLQVKTLGPSRPNEHYARTRGFYDRMGFRPLEENRLWGDVNPCLIMVKHLTCAASR